MLEHFVSRGTDPKELGAGGLSGSVGRKRQCNGYFLSSHVRMC